MARITGTVRKFEEAKGYGFIKADDGTSKDTFFHYSAIKMSGFKTLREGDRVEYEVVIGQKGPQANEVTKLGA